MSLIYKVAAEHWTEMCTEYEAAVEAQYQVALEECSGHLVNKRGLSEGVSSFSLFTGSSKRAYLYASEDLVTFWDLVPRLDKNKFERQWCGGRGWN